jgi:hypothetical protein
MYTSFLYQLDAKSFLMRVGGVLWGRRPPSAGGGPMRRRRPALRAGRRQNLSSFKRFLSANGLTSWPWEFVIVHERYP